MPAFGFDHSYARDLPGASVDQAPAPARAPRLLFLNEPLAAELGLDPAALRGESGAAIFSGNALPEDARPIAQAYAGHQFGGFSPQLGDGRALLLGELVDRSGRRRDLAFKGSGRTPFSRGGDGRAAVGPMLREVLVGEAMHALGIPTTRALAVAATGDWVFRESRLPGAVLTRVAASHLRVGSFQYFAARGDRAALQRLLDYAIARHDPALRDAPVPALALLQAVLARQAALVAQWLNVGFIHGVMNTDNMTISGETIDYGPCAFLEAYDPATVFSSIDHGGRYAYGRQPAMALWNLARLAEALLPLLVPPGRDEDEATVQAAIDQVHEVLDRFGPLHAAALLRGQRAKFGLAAAGPADTAADAALAERWLALLQAQRVDFTLAWRRLADAAEGDEAPLRALFGAAPGAPEAWLADWRLALARDDAAGAPAGAARAAAMRAASPFVIPRNHRVEEALAAASDGGELGPFERLLAALQRPYDETPEQAPYGEPAAPQVTACYQTFCGT
ncbi:protein adenylyltransferase SelO [Piscinibacter sakaiensis]|uniref:Protein nucleotidyltransferase YdiU n=1 Tax=Piscinibacter sakaiensis TaxID=1547922 RepID=A0A0K8P8S3_PISS1|nr:YdiU family protein [Piscinibacter sakaiensis]GAP38590.1 selenoprotein O and cysteine-containing homolog [Piscinibacter sakaiensis]